MKLEVEQSGHEPKAFFIDDRYREIILYVLGHFQLSEKPELTVREVFAKNV